METVEQTRQHEADLTASYGLPLSPKSPHIPQAPHTPSTNSPSPYQRKKANNPLVDLIETEQKYIENLKCLLQQVTTSWNSDNLPSSELDIMFRHIEAIYRQNKKFYSKLSKIGSISAPAKDLGETLLIWIEDMDGPYTKYLNFHQGFDHLPEIEENLTLQQTLNDISAEKNQPVSLDYFFDMPLKRLHYYKKLYMRLYRNTEPGRSDHSLLLAANERIDRLLEIEKNVKRSNKTIKKNEVVSSTVIPPATKEVVSSTIISPDLSTAIISPTVEVFPIEPSIKPQTIDRNWTLEELECQLDTSKTKDLFTKLPKVVNVTSLHSTGRKIVLHDDFMIETTISSGSPKKSFINAHVFLLTDLLLICQQITQEEKQKLSIEKNLKLMFPPLNIDHITINDVSDDKEDSFEMTVLQKEMLIFYASNKDIKENWLRVISKAVSLAAKKNPQSNAHSRNPRLSTISTLSAGNFLVNKVPASTASQNSSLGPDPPIVRSRTLDPPNNSGNLVNKIPNQHSSAGPDPPVVRSRTPDPPRNSGNSVNQIPGQHSSFGPDPPVVRSRTPDPPKNSGGQYPGDYLPSEQGSGQERRSDPIPSPILRNGMHVERTERTNSLTSLVSVMSIATFKETIFRSSACAVFVWVSGEWKPLTKKDNCIVEVRLTIQNKGCWVILLESSNRMVLNAWIHPTTTFRRENANSVSISCETGQRKEYYMINSSNPVESDELMKCLLKIKESIKELKVPTDGYISRSSSLQTIEPSREVEQTVTQVMEVKCRVFLQNDHGVWTNIGWGIMKLSIETPSHRKRIVVNSDKKSSKTIIDAIINEDGVEKIGKSVALTLNNMRSNVRIVYLLKMKEEESATKVFEIMKEKRKK